MAPEYGLTHFALFAQTLEESLLEMGDTGATSRGEEDIYSASGDAYRRGSATLRQCRANFPYSAALPDDTPNPNLDAPVQGREVSDSLRWNETGNREVDLKTSSWATAASVMCRKIADTLHLTMVSGSIFTPYVDYTKSSTSDRRGLYTRCNFAFA